MKMLKRRAISCNKNIDVSSILKISQLRPLILELAYYFWLERFLCRGLAHAAGLVALTFTAMPVLTGEAVSKGLS